MKLFEILVPCNFGDDGKPISLKHHKNWDTYVRKVANGLTILKPVKGQWINTSNEVVEDRVIPVRIACNDSQIARIMQFTLKHYRQDTVMAYELSNRVFFLDK